MGGNGRAGLVPVPCVACNEVDDIGLLAIIRSGDFDRVAPLIAYNPSSEAGRTWVEAAQSWYH